MKKLKPWIIGIILFFVFGWSPVFYIGLFLYVFIKICTKPTNNVTKTVTNTNVPNTQGIVLKCTKCDSVLTINQKFCGKCGEAFDGNNVKVEYDATIDKPIINNAVQSFVKPGSFDKMFGLSEDEMLEEFINRELVKAQIDKTSKLIPHDILKRKRIFNIIFSLLIFIYISLIFFHFPLLTYVIGIITLFIFYKLTRKYDLMKYLKKQLKARPSERVSNIVMSVKSTFTEDTSKKFLLPSILIGLILPLIIFIKPIILYEKTDGGYAVRYYIFGVTNFTSATIPETHNNEKIVSLRGNTFSNMPFLKEVTLPNSIIEIRGQAFKNNKALKTIKLPSNLNYLGGGAFYNCTSLEYIEIPDSVTYIGGEAFYNAKSLKNIKLSDNLLEIRGSTFENCRSLESIVIPDSVTRIGGHAFYGNRSLSNVGISENSKLTEIGSSAFRLCDNLYKITLPRGVYVNERAFKESPTDINEYGSFEVSNFSDSFQYHGSLYMGIAETKEINQYRTSANLQDAYITLVSVRVVNGIGEFTLKYKDYFGENVFTLSQQDSYKIINQNIAVVITGNYVFTTYDDKVSLYTYYN